MKENRIKSEDLLEKDWRMIVPFEEHVHFDTL